MKTIALIAPCIGFKDEKGYSRFRFLAQFLVENGYSVELITSTFQHWEKKQRDKKYRDNLKKEYKITFLNEPGYSKNIDFKRVKSNKILAQNVKNYLEGKRYDLVYCVIPPNSIGAKAVDFARENNIPIIIDVEDLWPEAMKMIFNIPIISNIMFRKFARDARHIYMNANAVVGTSDEYRDRALKDNSDLLERITVYVGNEISVFDEGVNKFRNEVVKNERDFWVTYAGNLGTSYDIKTLIFAAQELKKRDLNSIRVMILGGGPLETEFKKLAQECDCNVIFAGYLEYQKMAAYLSKSDVLVNSFVRKAPQSIVTKIGDYLAAGKPMINTCMSPEFRAKVESDGFGVNVEAENVNALADAIEQLYQNENMRIQMGQAARRIAEEQFDRKHAYIKIVDLVDRLIEKSM